MLARRLILIAVFLLPLSLRAAEPPFTEYSPLSRSTELVRRLLSPLNAARVMQQAKLPGHALREQSIELGQEKFAVHVPAKAPPHGYALLVFVPPWSEARVPTTWIGPLDRHGTIYVSAANSGNDADVLDRREPLAVLAAYNLMRRYPIDPQRVYIAGFSGGSRVALRLALGYPDLFHAVVLMAGSDPIGDAQIPLPPAALWRQFQQSTPLIYLTGQRDDVNLAMDSRSRDSMRHWCVADTNDITIPRAGHDLPDAAALGRALSLLEHPASTDTPRLAACRARIDQAVATQLQHAKKLLAEGKRDAARSLLQNIDAHYGGLAAPQSVALMAQTRQQP